MTVLTLTYIPPAPGSGSIVLPTVVTGRDVEEKIKETLQPRLDYYLEKLGYPTIRGWQNVTTFYKFPEDQLPLVIVSCSGLAEPPTKDGSGSFRAKWAVGIAALVSAKDQSSSNVLAKHYGALIRAVLLQEPGLHGFALGTSWIDETYNELPVMDSRTWASAEIVFSIEVSGVVNARELPYMPDGPIPTPSDYDADSINVVVEPVQEVNP